MMEQQKSQRKKRIQQQKKQRRKMNQQRLQLRKEPMNRKKIVLPKIKRCKRSRKRIRVLTK